MISEILRTHTPNYDVWAFGSRVTGSTKPYSDLDLVVLTVTPLSLHKCASLKEAFDESDLPYRVDVVDWATTSEEFKAIIRQTKIVVQSAELVPQE